MGHGSGSPVSWASFLPIFSFPRVSVLDLGSSKGQTDRQTDGQTGRLGPGAYCGVPLETAQLVKYYVVACRMGKPSQWGFDRTVTKKYGCKDFAYDPSYVAIVHRLNSLEPGIDGRIFIDKSNVWSDFTL